LAVAKEKLGLVHVITGNGKGKTTSGMGTAVRALGRGLKVKLIQFFKRDTGEQYFFAKLNVPYVQFQPLHPYFKKYAEEHFEDLKKELLLFWKKEFTNLEQFDVLIVDELGPGLNWKVIEEKTVLDFLKKKPKHLEVVLTGRDFPQSVLDKADYVSEVSMIKHPYQKGILAREGVEF